MNEENLAKKVERLEYYISLLRDICLDPEAYVLWDFIMAEGLDEDQAHQMILVFRKYSKILQDVNEKEDLAHYWSKMTKDLTPLFETFNWRTDQHGIYRVLLRASKLPEWYTLKKLVQYVENTK
ncbi:DUF1878 family protein [Caldifermentibacillus hisashii]|uniref:DUF1878 family protein n=1 Tax=Caldifermentibacillus hisashii TaxID=996558 RepID=UPI0034D634F9